MIVAKTCFLSSSVAILASWFGAFSSQVYFSTKTTCFFTSRRVWTVVPSGSCFSLGFVEVVLYLCQSLSVVRLVWVRVKGKGSTEVTPHIKKHLDAEVETFVHTLRRTAEAGLACVRVNQGKFSPHHYSASGLLGLCHRERRACIACVWANLIVHHREYSFSKLLVGLKLARYDLRASVHENILLSWMAVEIAV